MQHDNNLSTVIVEDPRPNEDGLSYCYIINTLNRIRFLQEIRHNGPFDPHTLSFENFLERCIRFNIIDSFSSSEMLINSNNVFQTW